MSTRHFHGGMELTFEFWRWKCIGRVKLGNAFTRHFIVYELFQNCPSSAAIDNETIQSTGMRWNVQGDEYSFVPSGIMVLSRCSTATVMKKRGLCSIIVFIDNDIKL